jgi:hypothetical protein
MMDTLINIQVGRGKLLLNEKKEMTPILFGVFYFTIRKYNLFA